MTSSDPSPVRTWFRVVAFAEAVSWAALLTAMFHKYVVVGAAFEADHAGVAVTGMIHGGVFVAFVAMSVVAWRAFGWSWKVLLVALASAVPPFATVAFERVADRKGLLQKTATQAASAP